MTKEIETAHIQAQFVSESGEPCGAQFDLPVNITVDKLRTLCNSLLEQVIIKNHLMMLNLQYFVMILMK